MPSIIVLFQRGSIWENSQQWAAMIYCPEIKVYDCCLILFFCVSCLLMHKVGYLGLEGLKDHQHSQAQVCLKLPILSTVLVRHHCGD